MKKQFKNLSLFHDIKGNILEATVIKNKLFYRESKETNFIIKEFSNYAAAESHFLSLIQKFHNKGYLLDSSSFQQIKNNLNEFPDLLENLNKKYENLKNHPDVFITHYLTFKPASDEEINEVEKNIGFPLPNDLKAFYKITNGLIFRWIYKKHINENEIFEFNKVPIDDLVYNYFYPPECINIIPIQQIFKSQQKPLWKNKNDGNYYDETIFYLIDKCNMYSGNLAFRFDREIGNYLYVKDDDHFAYVEEAEQKNFKDYINSKVLKNWTYDEIEFLEKDSTK